MIDEMARRKVAQAAAKAALLEKRVSTLESQILALLVSQEECGE